MHITEDIKRYDYSYARKNAGHADIRTTQLYDRTTLDDYKKNPFKKVKRCRKTKMN